MIMMPMLFRSLAAAAVAWGLMAAAATAKPLIERPVYNDETKSYFELMDITRYNFRGAGVPWFKARKLAERRSFAGVKGRLAVIPSAETDMFIRLTFRPDHHTWFGLYYDCGSRSLVWVTGQKLPASGYTNWREPWYRGQKGLFCRVSYSNQMPVYIAFSDPDRAWAIQLPAKYWYYYLVEYPTGKRIENDKNISPVSESITDLLARQE